MGPQSSQMQSNPQTAKRAKTSSDDVSNRQFSEGGTTGLSSNFSEPSSKPDDNLFNPDALPSVLEQSGEAA